MIDGRRADGTLLLFTTQKGSSMSIRIAMGQISSTDDKAHNLAQIERQVERAAAQGADVAVFPEFAMYQQARVDAGFVRAAEPLDGPFTTALREIAGRHRIVVAAGMLEQVPGGDRAYNTVYVADAQGDYLTHYRKVHMYNAFGIRESDIIERSDARDAVSFVVGDVTLGVMTCYDIRFPELARDLADRGVEAIVIPASWSPGPRKEDHWDVLARARAIENTVYVVAVSQAPPISTGGSLFVDPMGVVVGALGEEADQLISTVDPDRVRAVREKNPSLTDRQYAVSRIG